MWPWVGVITPSRKVVTRLGIAHQFSGASENLSGLPACMVPTGSQTLFIVGNMSWGGSFGFNLGGSGGTKSVRVAKSSNNGAFMAVPQGYSYNPAQVTAFSYSASLTEVMVVVQYNHEAKTITSYASNGSTSGAVSQTGTYAVPVANDVTVDMASSDTGQLILAAVANGIVSHRSLFDNPWQIFAP